MYSRAVHKTEVESGGADMSRSLDPMVPGDVSTVAVDDDAR